MTTEGLLSSMSALNWADIDSLKFAHVDDRYMCAHCHKVLQVPMMTQCGHRMCNDCAQSLLSGRPDGTAPCPAKQEDCVILSKNTIFPDFGTFRDLMKLEVYCINNINGCPEKLKWAKLKDHTKECMYSKEPCINRGLGCQEMVVKAKMPQHLEVCQFRTEMCVHCSVRIPTHLMKDHLLNACPEISIICPFKCGEQSIQRGELEKHKKECKAKPKDCMFQEFGCKFSGTDDQVSRHEKNTTAEHLEIVAAVAVENKKELTQLRARVQGIAVSSPSVPQGAMLSGEAKSRMDFIDKKLSSQDEIIKKTQMLMAQVSDEVNPVKGKLQGIERQLENMSSEGSTAQNQRLTQMEQTMSLCNVRLHEMDLRLQCVETASYNGILIWKIRDYRRRKQEAVEQKTVSLYSQPFYTSRYGYKACARIYLNGDGMGKGTHMSLFFVILRGDFDALLPWPFRQKVSMTLIDQDGGKNIIDSFRADPTSNSFKKPTTDMNIASGCPLFASQSVVENPPFLKDDCIFLKIQVDTTDLKDAGTARSGSF